MDSAVDLHRRPASTCPTGQGVRARPASDALFLSGLPPCLKPEALQALLADALGPEAKAWPVTILDAACRTSAHKRMGAARVQCPNIAEAFGAMQAINYNATALEDAAYGLVQRACGGNQSLCAKACRAARRRRRLQATWFVINNDKKKKGQCDARDLAVAAADDGDTKEDAASGAVARALRAPMCVSPRTAPGGDPARGRRANNAGIIMMNRAPWRCLARAVCPQGGYVVDYAVCASYAESPICISAIHPQYISKCTLF